MKKMEKMSKEVATRHGLRAGSYRAFYMKDDLVLYASMGKSHLALDDPADFLNAKPFCTVFDVWMCEIIEGMESRSDQYEQWTFNRDEVRHVTEWTPLWDRGDDE